MTTNLKEIEIKLLEAVQHGLPLSKSPYKDIAEQTGVDVEVVFKVLKFWEQHGRLRRIGAIVNHFRVGLGAGAMVVWNVPGDRVEEVGGMLAGFKQVSHAYQRPAHPKWKYNLYTMVHSADRQGLVQTVEQMSEKVDIADYKLLETVAELKKVPPTYVY